MTVVLGGYTQGTAFIATDCVATSGDPTQVQKPEDWLFNNKNDLPPVCIVSKYFTIHRYGAFGFAGYGPNIVHFVREHEATLRSITVEDEPTKKIGELVNIFNSQVGEKGQIRVIGFIDYQNPNFERMIRWTYQDSHKIDILGYENACVVGSGKEQAINILQQFATDDDLITNYGYGESDFMNPVRGIAELNNVILFGTFLGEEVGRTWGGYVQGVYSLGSGNTDFSPTSLHAIGTINLDHKNVRYERGPAFAAYEGDASNGQLITFRNWSGMWENRSWPINPLSKFRDYPQEPRKSVEDLDPIIANFTIEILKSGRRWRTNYLFLEDQMKHVIWNNKDEIDSPIIDDEWTKVIAERELAFFEQNDWDTVGH